jgi:hypothetical protein
MFGGDKPAEQKLVFGIAKQHAHCWTLARAARSPSRSPLEQPAHPWVK